MSRTKHFVLPIIWILVVFVFSTSAFGGATTTTWIDRIILFFLPDYHGGHLKDINFILRKTAHLIVYATLALLWWRALTRSTDMRPARAFLLALLVCVSVGTLDELHQAHTAGRTAKVTDTLLDSSAAAIALSACSIRAKKRRRLSRGGAA